MDISLGICVPKMKFCIVGHKIPLEGRVSQIFDLGLSSSKSETHFPPNGHHVGVFQISKVFREY